MGSLNQMGIRDRTQVKPCRILKDFAFVIFFRIATSKSLPASADFYAARDRNVIKVIDGHVVLIALVAGENHETLLIDTGSNAVLNRIECSGMSFVQVSFGHIHFAVCVDRLLGR